jgi:predicted nucleic acid-binding protein
MTLARAARATYLVSGDRHLTGLADPTPPILTPRQFRDRLTQASGA